MNCWHSLKKTIEQWARQSGFIQRKKVLTAFDFLALLTVGQLGMKHPSLAAMVEAIKVKMSREGMHRRFSVSAIEFMRRCSDFILNQKISAITSIRADLLRYFKRILIFDSSSWDIDPKLKNVLPGCGGSASEANCKSNTGRENRLCCEIYGKIIMAVMIHRIHAYINIRRWNSKRKELSMEKLYKRIQERAFIILDLLLNSLQKAICYLQEEIPRLIKNCMKFYQRSRRSTLEIIEYGPCQLGKMQMIKAA